MSRAQDNVALATLRELAGAVDAALDDAIDPATKRAAAVIFPYDGNVGNHMMWLAMMQYLRSRRIPLVYAAGVRDFRLDELQAMVGREGVILFSGGVTMSRLWPEHVEAKREIAATCRMNRLVSLMSTFLPADEAERSTMRSVFGDHPNVTLLSRDPVSAAHAREVFDDNIDVRVAHDLALRLAPRTAHAPSPGTDIAWLARDDAESAEVRPPPDVSAFDWRELAAPEYRRAFQTLRGVRAMSKFNIPPHTSTWHHRARATLFHAASRAIVDAGAARLRRARVLVTDRMHPHVLALQQNQPVVLLPDRYGKNRAVYDYSTHRFPLVHWADTPSEALSIARQLTGDN